MWEAAPRAQVAHEARGRPYARVRRRTSRPVPCPGRPPPGRAPPVASVRPDARHAPRRDPARAGGRRHRRRRGRRDRPRAGARRARGEGRRGGARPRPRRSPTAPRSRSSPTAAPEALELVRHDAAHVLADRGDGALPGGEDLDRPADRAGLLLRLRVPRRRHALRGRLRRRSRRGCASTSRPTSAFAREDVPVAAALERFRAEGQDYKVELIEDLVRDEGVETVSLYTNGAVHRPLPRPARARRRSGSRRSSSSRSPAPTGAATPSGRCSPASTAPPSSPRRSSPSTSSGSRQARARDHRRLGRELDLFMFSELSPGSPFWLPNGIARVERADRAVARRERRARLHRGAHADPLRRRPVEALGPLGQVPRQHVLHRRRGPADGAQAHELPGPRPDLRARAPLLPRPADPLRRAGPRAPPRAERHAARPAARAAHHAGRRAHLLHRGADRGGGRCAAWTSASASTSCSASRPRLELSTRPGEAHRQRRDVGPRRGGAAAARWTRAGSRTRSTRATAPSTGRRSTCT